MELNTFLSGSITTAGLFAVLIFLTKTWIKTHIDHSVRHEYDKKKTMYENQLEIRLRAELVADLMAEWIKDKENLDYHRLNQLSFQAFLWLPPQLACDLSNTLCHKPGSDDLRAIIIKVRKHLLGEQDDLDANRVIVFSKK